MRIVSRTDEGLMLFWFVLLIVSFLMLLFSSCAVPAVLTDQDWARLEKTVKPSLTEQEWEAFKKDLDDRTMTPEEFEKWKGKLAQDVAETLKTVVDVTPAPTPVKEPVKDILEYITYALVATWLGGKGLKQGADKMIAKTKQKK